MRDECRADEGVLPLISGGSDRYWSSHKREPVVLKKKRTRSSTDLRSSKSRHDGQDDASRAVEDIKWLTFSIVGGHPSVKMIMNKVEKFNVSKPFEIWPSIWNFSCTILNENR